MRPKIVAGNWKMHGSKAMVADLLAGLKTGLAGLAGVQTVVFPPFVYLEQVQQSLAGTGIAWGAQTMSANQPGAFTGEIAADMLKDFACGYVLIGHSERRTLYHEDDVLVAMKFAHAKAHGLTPIFCIGETQAEREAGQTEQVLNRQIDAVLSLEDGIHSFNNSVIAYEPVWAIGTGLTASPQQAQDVHQMIRQKLAALDETIAAQTAILYGGSVKASNAKELFAMADIDGGLIGGASLEAEQFVEIVRCIN